MNGLPLSPYLVLDLTIARAGPNAVRLLTDWGANVIKIEPPVASSDGKSPKTLNVTGARHSSDAQNLHRNKRGLTIDLKHPKGHALFMDLVAQADMVVENFRSDVKQRLGIDYESVRAVNPRIIYGSISGFGQDGPYANRPGVDQIVQGMSGLMSVTGLEGQGPVRAGIAISDTSAGMFLAQGLLLALLHRERTGEGQWVHTSLLESMLAKLDFQGSRYTMSGEVPKQQGNNHPVLAPMGTYESKDGLVNIAASSQKLFASFCDALSADELFDEPDFADDRSRRRNRQALNAAINQVTRSYSTAELIERLNSVGIPCGPVYDIGQAFEDQQAVHLKMTKTAHHQQLGDIRLVRSPINLSTFPHEETFHHAGPDPGEHNVEVLQELGIDQQRIDRLQECGVI